MKYMKNYLFAIAVAALAVAACDKTKVPEYENAPATTNEQVFFPGSVADQIKMGQGDVSFTIPIQRGSANLEALDVEIASSGEGLDYFSVPGIVSFAAKSASANLVVSVKDADALGLNNFYELTLSIADDALTTPYARKSITIKAGIELPWVKFDDGTLFEVPYWGEQEEKTMYYQQLTPTLRLCKIEGCFGHDTIESGGEYDVQDYIWYWNTETDACYIPVQWMGYENGNGKTYFSDEPAFYNLYWAMKNGVGYGAGNYGPGAGQEEGTEAWFEFCDACRKNWAGDPFPYYDGNGTFYLADEYIAGYPGNADEYKGRYTAVGDQDYFSGKNFGDYELSVEYNGMYVNPDNEAAPIINFASTKNSSKYFSVVKYAITSQDEDPFETLEAIVEGTFNGVLTLTLEDAAATIMPEIEPGLYTIVAVPFVKGDKNDKGESTEFKTGFAVALDFYFPGMNVTPTDVEAVAYFLATSDVYGDRGAQYGYYDYNSAVVLIGGTDITAGTYFFHYKATLDSYIENYGEDFVLGYGTAIDAEDVADINTENGAVLLFGGSDNPLDADTEWGVLLELKNKYGSSKTFLLSHTTDPEPGAAAPAAAPSSVKNAKMQSVRAVEVPNDLYDFNTYKINNQGWSNPSVLVMKAARDGKLKAILEK